MSDVPLGAMLSGGLDSSLIVGAHGPAHVGAGQDVLGRLREAGDGNELADARDVAELFGAEHHELELSFADDDGRPR